MYSFHGLHFALFRRDGIAMRVEKRIAQADCYPLLLFIGQIVLLLAGLCMPFAGFIAGVFGQILFQKPVAANHLERIFPSAFGQMRVRRQAVALFVQQIEYILLVAYLQPGQGCQSVCIDGQTVFFQRIDSFERIFGQTAYIEAKQKIRE
ncbi:hypothetical protein HMPREF1555_01461 [Porphyromonas gingivalis F0570]|uniref:Uncharacterized protein n=1 Tax=Porphyromonas gingivalis F0570 TaxID=1227271 RepID=A0A0E2LPP5_PORGN|nr:hypothetical protein HMPREF1555_01461 [Porphyromonas gingivalis F0570]